MEHLNRVRLIGVIQSPPTIRYHGQGIPIYHCLLRVDRPRSARGRRGERRYDEVNVIVHGDEAEKAHRDTKKGSLVMVNGYFHSRRYTKANTIDESTRENLVDFLSSVMPKLKIDQVESIITEVLDILQLNGHETSHVAYEVCAPKIEVIGEEISEDDKKLISLLSQIKEKGCVDQVSDFVADL